MHNYPDIMKSDRSLEVCRRCKASCCRLGGPDFTGSEKDKILQAGKKDFFVEINKNHFEIDCKRGVCPYLAKDNSCSIHDIRPLMCRVWPLNIEFIKDEKYLMMIDCPLTPFLSKKDILEMKVQLTRLQKRCSMMRSVLRNCPKMI
jgi:Uncharacterised protein family (UPF0153).